MLFFDTLQSTQTYLLEHLQENLCIIALRQTQGLGSRGNKWEEVESGLYFSFCLSLESLPKDLKLQSASIFFGFLFKELLCERGFAVWLKWPNDIYMGQKKIGGVLVNQKKQKVICGIGINLISQSFGSLGCELDRKEVLEQFFKKLKNTSQWKQSFRKYKLEFYKNLDSNFHYQDEIIPLKEVQLLDDGAIFYDGKIIYSSR